MRIKNTILTALALTLAVAPAWAQRQRMAIPTYFGPGDLWTKAEAGSPPVGLTIINPASGPGDAVRDDYVRQVRHTKARGLTVLGYVDTAYGKRPLADVQADVEKFYRWYNVQGIFFDESTNDDANLAYYKQLHDAVHAAHPKAVIVINPGTPVTEGYMGVADIVLTFESGYDAYLKRDPDAAWVARYPARRFWHLVYGTPDIASMRNAVKLSKQRHAGWVYITPDTLPNPWDTLPDSDYWAAELTALNSPK